MTLAPSPIPELDDAEWDMISRGDMLGSRLGAKTATTITTLLEKLAAAAAALEPFAAAAEDIDETTPDRAEMWEDPASMNVSAGDFRRARSALADKGVAKNG